MAHRTPSMHPASVARNSQNVTPSGASPSDILSALERVRKSRTMRGSKKLVQFLNFVVETTLRGRAHELKETTVAVSVFGRAPDYDPKTDTVVRNQALRLRSKLRDYYASEGSADPLVIHIPKGQYSPTFVPRGGPALGQPGTSSQRQPRLLER